jgi:hypothetical protein
MDYALTRLFNTTSITLIGGSESVNYKGER